MHNTSKVLELSWKHSLYPNLWKNHLLWNWSLVSKRLGTYDFKTCIYSVRWKKNKAQRCQYNSTIYKLVTQRGGGGALPPQPPSYTWDLPWVCDVKAPAVAVDRGICYKRDKRRPRKSGSPTPVTWAAVNIIIRKATCPPWSTEISCQPSHKVSSDTETDWKQQFYEMIEIRNLEMGKKTFRNQQD